MESNPYKSFEGPREIVSDKDISSLINDIEKYDTDHSSGAWLGRGLGAVFSEYVREDEDSDEIYEDESVLDDIPDDTRLNLVVFEDLVSSHSGVLEKIGLELESANKKGDYDENELYAVGQVAINIVDRKRFLEYVQSISTPTESQKKLLEMLATKLSSQVKGEYLLDEADDRLLELFSGLKDMISEYERLGLSDQIQEFKKYKQYAGQGLKEYILARNNNIFEPIGEGFNLSTYQRDATPEYYVDRWNKEVFDTLKVIKQKPKAEGLYRDILEYARECIAFAENDPSLVDENLSPTQAIQRKKLREAIQMMKEKVERYIEAL